MLLVCSPPSVASMNVIIHSAPWRPWQKSAIVPAAPLAKGLEFLSFSDRNTCLLSLIMTYSSFFNSLTDYLSFVCMYRRLRDGQGRTNPTVQGKDPTVRERKTTVQGYDLYVESRSSIVETLPQSHGGGAHDARPSNPYIHCWSWSAFDVVVPPRWSSWAHFRGSTTRSRRYYWCCVRAVAEKLRWETAVGREHGCRKRWKQLKLFSFSNVRSWKLNRLSRIKSFWANDIPLFDEKARAKDWFIEW